MRVMVTVTEDCALACIMQELYFNKGKLKRMNKNIFRNLCSSYMFANGEMCKDDHYFEQYYEQALEIVNKYYK